MPHIFSIGLDSRTLKGYAETPARLFPDREAALGNIYSFDGVLVRHEDGMAIDPHEIDDPLHIFEPGDYFGLSMHPTEYQDPRLYVIV